MQLFVAAANGGKSSAFAAFLARVLKMRRISGSPFRRAKGAEYNELIAVGR
ncbi:hypothetical protein HZZ13_35325 [Bradyrhizobium sp. CNPSo 4010]|uniref:Uncharacterized protein n=1 Tax=Bradyrhizobium agreste TaxID=2751811 RepID=A0ABS0Q0L3_9BRAD|nr:hypothetical protein [Bradyrhizobium agreste]MBH5403029.1 hypothetical protein [Bradyrhizobium agreste]